VRPASLPSKLTKTNAWSNDRAGSARQCWPRLKALQARHPLIGDVRGGDGLFAVVELVRERATRESPAPWPESPPALKALVRDALQRNVSFAIRGNLILLAPPLVISENELGDALSLLDELLAAVHF
jgi:taurine--2-oxoglutarate transaminase